MITTDDELIARLSVLTGLERDDLFMHVAGDRIRRVFSYPLNAAAADEVVDRLAGDLTRAAMIGVPAEVDAASRYVWLDELVTRYQAAETRKVVIRVSHAGQMPAWASDGDGYDPSVRGWDLDPEEYDEELVRQAQTWEWWKRVKAAGVRESWRMPDPYVGAHSDVPIDHALDERERTGNEVAYRAALKRIRDANYRDIDAWAHSGHEATARADAVAGNTKAARDRRTAALNEALGFFQTGVAVGELSLPVRFTGVLPWSSTQNRPFHRARHGLALVWWRLGDFERAAKVLRCSLWINPEDNQGCRDVLPIVEAGRRYEDADLVD